MTVRADLSDATVERIIGAIPQLHRSVEIEKWCVTCLWAEAWPGWPESMPLTLDDATVSRAVRDRVRAALVAALERRSNLDALVRLFDGSAPKAHEDVPDEPAPVADAN